MKCLHVVPSLMAEGGGPSYTVPRLAEALTVAGWDAEIATLEAPAAQTCGGVAVRSYARDPALVSPLKKLGRSRAMAQAFGTLGGDVLHAHGLWMMPNVYPARWARQTGQPLVHSTHGMLGRDALRFSATAKRLFWLGWQKKALAQVSCFHATAQSELEDIRDFGLDAPVAIIPNGVDLPDPAGARAGAAAPFVLSLGRLHPKKGLQRLVEAFARVAPDFPDWGLRIAGLDEGGHADTLRRSIASAGLGGRAQVTGPVFGAEKFRLMGDASLFAFPSLHENFGVTVAESLAVETPVISSKGAPWADLETHKCGWWVDHGTDALAASLRVAMALSPAARAEMGKRGRAWMRRDFAWDGIGARTAELYDWLHGRAARPSFVEM